jgi:hypothetical protein
MINMNLNTTSFFNSTEVDISSRMNEYLKKNFGYEVEGDFDTLQEAKKSLQAEQLELKDNYMSAKYVENMLMIETITSLLKAHGKDKKAIKEDDGLIKRQDGKYDQADIAHGKDDGKLRLDPATGKYDPDEIRAMQYQQNVADPLNREIDASQKAHTIEVDYDLELDKPKSKNPLLKKHYKEMRKFNVFISMPEWQEGPPDSGFGIWTAKVRGSKKNLLGWLKAWEFDYDKEQLADMGLEEAQLDEFGPDERYLKVGNTTTIANKKTGSVSSNLNLGGDKNVRVNNHFNKDGSQGKVTASGTVGGMKFKASNQANFKTPKASVNGVNIPLNASKKRKVKEEIMTKGGIKVTFNTAIRKIVHLFGTNYLTLAMKKFGINSLDDLETDADKQKFFNYVYSINPKEWGQYRESIKEEDDEEKGPDHYRWKNDSQLAVVIGRIEGAIDELDNAIQYRGENSAEFFNNGDKAGVGGLMGIKQKLEDIHSEWDKNTEYYGM